MFGSDKATKSTLAGNAVHNFNAVGQDRNENEIKFLVNSSLLKNHKNKPIGVAVFCLDLKEEERKQKELNLSAIPFFSCCIKSSVRRRFNNQCRT